MKKVIQHVGGRVVASEYFVEGEHRAKIEVKLLAELSIHLVHVSVELFQKMFKTIEHCVQRCWSTREVGAHKLFKDG